MRFKVLLMLVILKVFSVSGSNVHHYWDKHGTINFARSENYDQLPSVQLFRIHLHNDTISGLNEVHLSVTHLNMNACCNTLKVLSLDPDLNRGLKFQLINDKGLYTFYSKELFIDLELRSTVSLDMNEPPNISIFYTVWSLNNARAEDPEEFSTDKRKFGCERNTLLNAPDLHIFCHGGKLINIKSANFGRTVSSTRICAYNNHNNNLNCINRNTITKVSAMCNEKNECRVPPTTEVFGDSCEGTYKYLNITYICKEVDPCRSAVPLDEEWRSTKYRLVGDAHCDNNMRLRWYNFTSPAGNMMPIEAPRTISVCGTFNPIWMSGKLPVNNTEIKATACARSDDKLCAQEMPMRVKHCGNYYVYKLGPTPACDMAYCAGDRLRCPNGTTSEDEFGPNCIKNGFPKLNGYPHIDWTTNQTTNQMGTIIFQCHTPGITRPMGNVTYMVDWYVNARKIRSDEGPNRVHKLLEKNERNVYQWHIPSEIWCKVKAKYVNQNDTPPSPARKSNNYFAGIKIWKRKVHHKVGPYNTTVYGNITFKLTVPFFCTVKNCLTHPQNLPTLRVTYAERKVDTASCPSCVNEVPLYPVFISPQSGRGCEIRIKAGLGSLNNQMFPYTAQITGFNGNVIAQKNYVIRIETTPSTYNKLWQERYRVGSVEVSLLTISTGQQKKCSFTTDPRITTYENTNYNHHIQGEFIVYRHRTLPIQVNYKFTSCQGSSLTCVCGVAVRVGRVIAIISRCEYLRANPQGQNTPVTVQTLIKGVYLNKCKLPVGFRIYEDKERNQYVIHLPTGGTVRIMQGNPSRNKAYFYIDLNPASSDLNQSEGLCGVLGNGQYNDLRMRNGQIHPVIYPGESPTRFNHEWRARPSEKLWGGTWNDNSTTCSNADHCKCEEKKTDGKPVAVCKPKSRVMSCVRSLFKDVTREFIREAEQQSSSRKDLFTVESSIENPVDNTKKLLQSNPNLSWTRDAAQRYCTKVFRGSLAGQKCNELPNVNISYPIAACVMDLMDTNDTFWANEGLESYKMTCMTATTLNISAYKNESGKLVPPTEIENLLCANNCSGKGNCIGGKCSCIKGYINGDCSRHVSDPPKLQFIPLKGLCSVRSRPCQITQIFGENFVYSDNLTCHVNKLPISGEGPPRKFSISGQYESNTEVRCGIPDMESKAATGYLYKISNNGVEQNASQSVLLVAYDPVCQKCEGDGSLNCTFKGNSCLIKDFCYAPYEEKPNATCFHCLPSVTNRMWTLNKTSCFINDVCYKNGEPESVTKFCKVCQPKVHTAQWALQNNSCLIDESCYIAGDHKSPSEFCKVCDVKQGTAKWSHAKNTCYIENACFSANVRNKNATCLQCQPNIASLTWTLTSNSCFIQNKCYVQGQSETNKKHCKICHPGQNVHRWSLKTDTCLIQEKCYNTGETKSVSEFCKVCNVSVDAEKWSHASSSCYIEGQCYRFNETKKAEFCKRCDPTQAVSTWSLLPSTCFIQGNCYKNGTVNQANSCQSCNPARSLNAWTGCVQTENKGMSPGKISVIVIGSVIGIALIASLVAITVFHMERERQKRRVGAFDEKEPPYEMKESKTVNQMIQNSQNN